ncbi:hypothetical protein LCGC14_0758110 [marine sediment metagenome]|uniref:Phage terminase large subunit N-terminal domain-containing protein n=1 Tax=marine sediment metagenome TaxID=412755 RepID=A0A0F9Q642_9ZZZZ
MVMTNKALHGLCADYQSNWNDFASEVLNVKLDDKQQEILEAVRTERRVSVRSGNARGKDYVAAIASLCFLYLNKPSKVINTAPTGRQVKSIMMSEIAKIHGRTKVPLGGEMFIEKIKIPGEPDWFLEGFKAVDKSIESWTGFHSPNLMVVVTEASGIETITYNAIESILTGNSRLLIVFNPNRRKGEAYESTKSPLYKKFKMNCLDAPNVLAKRIIYPGQVDWEWIDEKIRKPGWVTEILESEVDKSFYDFQWEGKWYRPGNLARVKILGEFPMDDPDTLIPMAWIEMANQRWLDNKTGVNGNPLKLGVDVAGMGRDMTIFVHRYRERVEKIDTYPNSEHMTTAGRIRNIVKGDDDYAFIDSIGEGAGVYSRNIELNKDNGKKCNVVSAKFSHSAKGKKDYTGQKTFINIRAYCYWAIRDALDPEHGFDLELPPDEELMQELNETRWDVRSNGDIFIEEKDKIKERLGRSPDKADGLALSFYPHSRPRARMIA